MTEITLDQMIEAVEDQLVSVRGDYKHESEFPGGMSSRINGEYRNQINRLQAAIERLEQTRWIPVSEQWPEEGEEVLILPRPSATPIAIFMVVLGREPFGWNGRDYKVTHWMPLPKISDNPTPIHLCKA